MVKISYVKFENIYIKLGVAATPQKFIGGQFSTKCHNSRMNCPRKLILN